MIYCYKGWVRVVYDDQGPPFVMHAGDCVLQPPEIRHRVLESSPGLEVIEIGCPAQHETWADPELDLPTAEGLPQLVRFLYHLVQLVWFHHPQNWPDSGKAGVIFPESRYHLFSAGFVCHVR